MPWGSSNLILRLILETLLILSYATAAMSIQTIVWRQFRVCTTTLGEDLYRNILIALIITIIVAIINEAVILFNRFRKAEIEASSLREENLTAQLAFLKNQINPHFLFNSLNSIYFLVEKSPEKAKDLISNFSEVLSHLLYESKGKYVPLSKELEYLQNYVELERVRQGDVVHFNSKIEAPGNIQVPPLIITTVVENAFKHGFGSGMDNYKIDFYIHSDEKNLTIECSNSFKRLSEQSNNGKGIGLKNLKRRLDLLYDDQYNLIIEDEEPMFIVKLSIPIKNELD